MMKMVLAIVNKEDSRKTQAALNKEGFTSTKLATTGGFLMTSNVTLLIGTEEDRVDTVLSIVEHNCKKRTQIVPNTIHSAAGLSDNPVSVCVGGATVFVIPVDRFERL